MIMSTENLFKNLYNEKLLIIDTRSFKEYASNHIPGAVNLDLFSFHWVDSSKQGIKNFNLQMEKIFSFAGVDETKRVVFYDDISGMLAARGVWLLQYFSHPDVFLLDGGLQKWKNEGKPVEQKLNAFKPTEFQIKPNELLVGYEYLSDNINKITIIDCRSVGEYNGTILRAARGGHIPNAINVDWTRNITKNGVFKNDLEISKLYPFSKNSEIITYCQGAYRAANSYLALKKSGFKNVKVYLGSWGEWGNKLDLPVV